MLPVALANVADCRQRRSPASARSTISLNKKLHEIKQETADTQIHKTNGHILDSPLVFCFYIPIKYKKQANRQEGGYA